MKKLIQVEFTVKFCCEFLVDEQEGDDLQEIYSDEISCIDIPEGGNNFCQYVENSFQVESVEYNDR